MFKIHQSSLPGDLTNKIPSGIVNESSEESLFEAKLLNVSERDLARNDKKGHTQSSKLQAYLTVLKNVVK